MIERLIKNHGGQLVRQRNHRVFGFPGGRIFVIASSPSDHRAEANNLARLARLLSLTKQELLGRPAKRNAPAVVVAPVPAVMVPAPAALVPVPPVVPVPPAPRSERKFYQRLERHEAQRKVKRERQLAQLREKVQWLRSQIMDFPELDGGMVAIGGFRYFRKRGFDVEIMLAEAKTPGQDFPIFVLRVGNWFVDLASGIVHETQAWIDGGARIEVVGPLEVVEDGEFVSLEEV